MSSPDSDPWELCDLILSFHTCKLKLMILSFLWLFCGADMSVKAVGKQQRQSLTEIPAWWGSLRPAKDEQLLGRRMTGWCGPRTFGEKKGYLLLNQTSKLTGILCFFFNLKFYCFLIHCISCVPFCNLFRLYPQIHRIEMNKRFLVRFQPFSQMSQVRIILTW